MEINYITFNSNRRFGVEIEVNKDVPPAKLTNAINDIVGKNKCVSSGWGYTCNNDYWVIKPDSSCGDLGNKSKDGGGYELATAVGHGAKHLCAISEVVNGMKKCGAKVNKYCGLHCQVEIKDFDNIKAAILLAYWCKIERLLSHMVPVHRNSSLHCRPHTLSSKWGKARTSNKPDQFWGYMRLSNLGPHGKRNTMTLVNYQRTQSKAYDWYGFDRPTVELRLPESSLEYYDVKNWARLFVHFVDVCFERNFPEDLSPVHFREFLEILGLKNGVTVLSPGLFETKCWLLHRFKQFSSNQNILSEVYQEWNEMICPGFRWRYSFPQVANIPDPKEDVKNAQETHVQLLRDCTKNVQRTGVKSLKGSDFKPDNSYLEYA